MQDQLLVHKTEFSSLAELFGIENCIHLIAGPCSIENMAQMESLAQFLSHKNIRLMRGGAYKPRTSPYDFQGLGREGLKLMKTICDKYSLISVSEILDPRDVEESYDSIDIIQIGSRSMQNTALLKEVGRADKPILLKRGLMSTLSEFLHAAEYIIKEGNKNLILCERGIRTIEDSVRNTLDISSIAIIKKETTLPVVVDLSHSLGRKDILVPITKAVVALGADAIMLEVHDFPERALSDKKQQLSLQEFDDYYNEVGELLLESRTKKEQ